MIAKLYAATTGADTPDASEARRGAIHLICLTMTKLADALIDPKLVLAWLLTSLGAPGALIGALVPVREAGSLLPQLALARMVERAKRRRLYWSAGSALQGIAALAMTLAVLMLSDQAASWAIVAALAVLALARSACSVSYKDTLARTIPKTRRGAITGAAGSVAAVAALAYGGALATGLIPLEPTAIAIAIAAAGALWLLAAAAFTTLKEGEGGSDPTAHKGDLLTPLYKDAMLRRFIAARALLTVTALAPPFIVVLSSTEEDSGPGTLGPLMLASAAASIVSSYIWGRLSDHSSRQTLIAAGALASVTLAVVGGVGIVTGSLYGSIGAVAAIFCSQIAYEGVRAGRKLHLTDMTTDDKRARYTAISNTIIGGTLLVGGGFGVLSDLIGTGAVLLVFSVLAAASVPISLTLREVQNP